MQKSTTRSLAALALVGAAVLSACSADDSDSAAESAAPSATESPRAQPRLVVSYDGGIRVLDARSLEQIADVPRDGFLRLNPAGDSRHVLVSTDSGFEVFDSGAWREGHGDHHHYYTAQPRMTDIAFDGPKPGHVVVHDDTITLFFDGTGEARTLAGDALSDRRLARAAIMRYG